MSDIEKAITLAKNIEKRAGILAHGVVQETLMRTKGDPKFSAIILRAVIHKLNKEVATMDKAAP
jgi:hypothetical protein